MHTRPIKTPADHRAALEEIERLMDARPGTPVGDRLDILTTLVSSTSLDTSPSGLRTLKLALREA